MNDNLNELYHYGVSGQHWYTHQFGNWERHARYANGRPNPETMGKRDAKRGAYDAKRDAAIQVLNKPKDFNVKQRAHASGEMTKVSDYLKGGLVGDIALGAGLVLSTGRVASSYALPIASPISAAIPLGMIAGGVGYNAYKQNKSIKGYNERYKDSTKDFNKELSKSTIKRLGLSKEYVDAYSKAMDEALKTYDKYRTKDKFAANNNGNLKYAGDKNSKKEIDPEKQATKDRKQGEFDAKNDVAVQILDKGEKRTIDEVYKANTQLTIPSLSLPQAALEASLYGLTLGFYDLGKSKAIKGYDKRYDDDTSYLNIGTKKRIINNNSKEFNTQLSKSKIKELGLSKDYVDAYSKAMNKTLAEYDKLRKTGTFKNVTSPALI